MEKYKLVTHKSDLDGMGCAILLKIYTRLLNELYGEERIVVDIDYCDYSDLAKTVKEFRDTGLYEEYDVLYITDLAIEDESVVIELDYFNKLKCFKSDFKVMDHHIDSFNRLNDKDYAIIDISKNKSAVKIMYDYLNEGDITIPSIVGRFVEHVSSYDTWKWVEINDVMSEMLNVNCYNRVKSDEDILLFVDYMVELLLDNDMLIEKSDEAEILKTIRERDELISRKLNDLYKTEIKGHKAGVVFVTNEEYKQRSLLGNKLCIANPDISFVALVSVDSDKMSFRSNSDEVDLNELAHDYGGGGHIRAAGAIILNIDDVMKMNEYKDVKKRTHLCVPAPGEVDIVVVKLMNKIFG